MQRQGGPGQTETLSPKSSRQWGQCDSRSTRGSPLARTSQHMVAGKWMPLKVNLLSLATGPWPCWTLDFSSLEPWPWPHWCCGCGSWPSSRALLLAQVAVSVLSLASLVSGRRLSFLRMWLLQEANPTHQTVILQEYTLW